MNTECLLAHYERIADAPDAIPRLRRFILDLAVRGKLVPQDPNDEPASELLKRIAAARARLVEGDRFKKLMESQLTRMRPRSIFRPVGFGHGSASFARRRGPEALHRLILSLYFQAFIIDEQTGAGRGGLPKNRMDRIPVALPPLAEQHRIVAKVDELMALCDRLEASLATGDDARRRLLDALLAEALAPGEGLVPEEPERVAVHG